MKLKDFKEELLKNLDEEEKTTLRKHPELIGLANLMDLFFMNSSQDIKEVE